jgi:DNA-binding GntR family transcriptional regulator
LIKYQISNIKPPARALDDLSVEDGVYLRLREAIAELRLRPGERLPLERVAEMFGVSQTPVRQALRRLESEGLVASVRHRGSYVAHLSVEELEEVQAIRIGLEGLLAYHGAADITEEALLRMKRARTEMERTFRLGDVDGYIASFWAFRDACYDCAERPRAMRTLADLRLRVERYVRHLCKDAETFALLRRGPDRLLEACRAHDPEAAEEATREALQWVLSEFTLMLAREAA